MSVRRGTCFSNPDRIFYSPRPFVKCWKCCKHCPYKSGRILCGNKNPCRTVPRICPFPWYILFLVRISPYCPPIWIFEMLKIQMERRRTTPNTTNSPAALSNKNRQKKNRKGSVTFTVIGNSNSIVWRLYFYFQGRKYRCIGRNFFNWFPAVLWYAMYW